MNQEKMGKFIAECRKSKHLTQAQLAEQLGITDKTVSKWENGTNAPNIALLNPLSDLLDISTEELLNGERNNDVRKKKDSEVDIPSILEYYVNINNKKSKKKMAVIITILVLAFISLISILILKNNYDNCYIYSISSSDADLKVEGLLVLTGEQDILLVNSIYNASRYDLDKEKVINYEYALVSSDIEIDKHGNILDQSDQIYNYSMFNDVLKTINFSLKENSNYDLVINDSILKDDQLSIRIKYIDDQFKEHELLIPLKLNKIFSNNKLIYKGGSRF